MKSTRIIVNDNPEKILAKGTLLFVNLYKMSYIPCVIFGLFLYDILFIHGYDDMMYAQGYLIYAVIGLVFLVILIRAYYLYLVYKDHAKRMYICKKIRILIIKLILKKNTWK